MKSGGRLGLYYWADTGCSVKHAYVDEFFEGKSVNVTGFTSTLGYIDKPPPPFLMYGMNLIKRTEMWSCLNTITPCKWGTT